MLPGFVDSHLHMLNYAFVKQSYQMFSAGSVEEVIREGQKIAERMKDEDRGQWIYGRGWNEENFSDEKRPLDRFDLDKISEERPILFIRVCGHKAAVNTKALETIMALPQTKDYISQIDQEKGILTEASVKLCYDVMQEPSVEKIKEMILSAQKDINAHGITGVETDNFLSLPGRNSASIMQAYRELEQEGRLTLRVREQASFTAFDHMKAFIDAGNRTGDGGEYYTIGPVKLYEDGSLGARTALMNHPYVGTDQYGTAVHDQEDTDRLVDYAYKNNMQILIHAIGDKAMDMVVNSIEKALDKYLRDNHRHGVVHCQLTTSDLLNRFRDLKLHAYVQSIFLDYDINIVEDRIGVDRAKTSYNFNTLFNETTMSN